jgi:hypothetical protein
MVQFATNPNRHDPYKQFKFRVKWDNQSIAVVSQIGAEDCALVTLPTFAHQRSERDCIKMIVAALSAPDRAARAARTKANTD